MIFLFKKPQMACPPMLLISNSQSNTTTASISTHLFRSFLFHLSSTIRHGLYQCRPSTSSLTILPLPTPTFYGEPPPPYLQEHLSYFRQVHLSNCLSLHFRYLSSLPHEILVVSTVIVVFLKMMDCCSSQLCLSAWSLFCTHDAFRVPKDLFLANSWR